MTEGELAEGVGFEPTREQNPLPVFKTGALNHSATLPSLQYQTLAGIYGVNNLATATARDTSWTKALTASLLSPVDHVSKTLDL